MDSVTLLDALVVLALSIALGIQLADWLFEPSVLLGDPVPIVSPPVPPGCGVIDPPPGWTLPPGCLP